MSPVLGLGLWLMYFGAAWFVEVWAAFREEQ